MSERPGKAERVDVFELSRTRERRSGRIELAQLPRLAAMLVDVEGGLDYLIAGGPDRDGHPGAHMQLAGAVRMNCNRCGRPVQIAIERDLPFRFVRSEAEANAIPVDEDEDIEIIVGSTALPIADWVEDEALLSLPLAPRHEDCEMPALGAHAGPEEEVEEARPNPFAVLETLKRGPQS